MAMSIMEMKGATEMEAPSAAATSTAMSMGRLLEGAEGAAMASRATAGKGPASHEVGKGPDSWVKGRNRPLCDECSAKPIAFQRIGRAREETLQSDAGERWPVEPLHGIPMYTCLVSLSKNESAGIDERCEYR